MNHKTRLEYIRVLLRTRNDYLYSTADPKGCFSRFGSLPGELAQETPCKLCRRTGKVLRKQGGWEKLSYCPSCNGSGWKRVKSEARFDPYTREREDGSLGEKVTHSESKNPPSMTAKQLDYALESLRNQAASRAGMVRDRDQIEVQRDRRDTSGSYQELDQALSWLHHSYPDLHRVLMQRYVLQLPTMPLRESLAVNLLSQRMPRKIRIPSWEYRKIRDKRRNTIKALLKKQIAPKEIARVLGVSVRTVLRQA